MVGAFIIEDDLRRPGRPGQCDTSGSSAKPGEQVK